MAMEEKMPVDVIGSDESRATLESCLPQQNQPFSSQKEDEARDLVQEDTEGIAKGVPAVNTGAADLVPGVNKVLIPGTVQPEAMNGNEAEGDVPGEGGEGDDQAKGGDNLVKGGGGDMLAEGGTQGEGDMLADRGEEADQADGVEGEMLAEGGGGVHQAEGGEGEMLAEGGGGAYQPEGGEEDVQGGEGGELAEEEEEGDEMMAAELVIGIEKPLI